MKTIVFARQAAKQLDALPSDAQASIEAALWQYALTGTGDVKRLTARGGSRLRVGNYRVFFKESDEFVWILYMGRRNTTTYH